MLKRLAKEIIFTFIVLPVILVLGFTLTAKASLFINQTPEKVDYIVAISGGDTLGRTQKAVELSQTGFATKLILSGDAADPTAPSNAQVMRDFAVSKGVPAEQIIVDETSSNTHENAINCIKILKENGAKSIILVTSAYHTKRAAKEFKIQAEKEGMTLRIISVQAKDKNWNENWLAHPDQWLRIIAEIIKVWTIK